MVTAIILSGGIGTRIKSDIPKQYIEVQGRPVIADCIDTFEAHPGVGNYIIVAAHEWHEYIKKYCGSKLKGFADPGAVRQLSIYNGLMGMADFASDNDVVIVHDAARPFVSAETISALIAACESADGAMPALPVKDTMYLQENGHVKSLVDRDSLIAGQAPEAFGYGKYVAANETLLPDAILKIKGSTEPAFLAGMDVAVIAGDEGNYKITTEADLERYIRMKGEA